MAGLGVSLYWIDFNLYLTSLGLPTSFLGIVAAAGSAASALAAFPASVASDRIGRRPVLIAGLCIAVLATLGLIFTTAPAAILLLAVGIAVGNQAFSVVTIPFLTEHSSRRNRGHLFSAQYAVQTSTSVGAALVGAAVAAIASAAFGLKAGDPGVYRILLVLMAVFGVAGLLALLRLRDDRPRMRRGRSPEGRPADAWEGEPIAQRDDRRPRPLTRVGIVVHDRTLFVKLLLPGFLTALGAGQVIPFLNVYIQGKFGLSLTSLNLVFAISALGTTLAILLQPVLARRVGKVGSVVVVQAVSIPFILVLGFSPVLWTVILALTVRNSLMNAGSPMVTAFAQEQVRRDERATLAAAQSLLWSLGWVIAGLWYAGLQAALGFEAGYTVNFITIITLYSVATILYWWWFHGVEARQGAQRVGAAPG